MRPVLRVRTGINSGFVENPVRGADGAVSEVSLSSPGSGYSAGVFGTPLVSGWSSVEENRLYKRIMARIDTLLGRQVRRFRSTWNTREKVIVPGRFWELDALRGVAIVMMLLGHLSTSWLKVLGFSLSMAVHGFWILAKSWIMLLLLAFLFVPAFFNPDFPRLSTRLKEGTFARGATQIVEISLLVILISWLGTTGSGGSSFMLLMGMAMTISYAKMKDNPARPSVFKKNLTRGLELLGLGMLLTAFSFWIIPTYGIFFGILHMLGVSTVLATPFLALPAWISLLSGLGVIGAGAYFSAHPLAQAPLWSMPFGHFAEMGIGALDYYPLLPFFGVILLGIVLGKVLYKDGKRQITPPDIAENKLVESLELMGRNSLGIFLLQEPLYILGVTALGI
jgi:uncharacterized membrane protein